MDNKPEAPREKHSVTETFERLWSQALLAVNTAEEEASRAVQRVAAVAGWSQDEVKRQAREFSERLAGHRKDLEHNVEERVRQALTKMKLPRREELAAFGTRLDKLAERIQALEHRK
ncbi:phasin family protein [Myxococcus xanthus]|uniref:phasin family protein n=1 Tax=Myxococcus xanthus TaxID=34 RepID=UPI00191721DB|nr:phasin family protein [Myxococcus xanthus]QQR47307.1 phasin family protein [Myxococcus xanthus]